MQSSALQQRWSLTLLAISVLGTFVAGVTLLLDGWFDALALYVACVLTLALLLSHISRQQVSPRTGASVNEGGADFDNGPPGLVLTRTPGAWAGTDQATGTAALGATPMD